MDREVFGRPWIGLFPLSLFYLVIFIIPFSTLVYISFTKGSSFFFETIVSFSNWTSLFSEYGTAIANSFKLTSGAALVDLVFGYPLAYIFARKQFPGKDFVRALMVFPFFGGLFIAFGLSYLFLPGAPLSFIFDLLNIPPTDILYSPYSVILGFAIYTSPFMILYTGVSLQGIDPELENAARCLGANSLQAFFRITLPLSLPGAITGFLVCFGWNLGGYIIPLLLGGPSSNNVITVNMVQLATTTQQYGQAAALGVFLMFSIGLIFYTAMRISGRVLL